MTAPDVVTIRPGEESIHANSHLWLPPVLSMIAGLVDVAGFLLLGHIFTAHITGNLVVIAADLVSGGPWNPVQVIALPVFIAAVGVIWLLAEAWGRTRSSLLRLLLIVHFVLLAAVLVCSVSTHASASPGNFASGLTAMIAISAMACQFALMRLALPVTSSTAVMTGNLTNSVLALLDLVAAKEAATGAVRQRLMRSINLIGGFLIGCFVASAAIPVLGDWIWSLPAALAAIAIAI